MARPKVDDETLFNALTELFRERGYDGVSLSQIAERTGLQKASLYHRFPGGKEEMVLAVLERAGAWLENNAFEPLRGTGDLKKRLINFSKCLREFYEDGDASCLLYTLSFSPEDSDVRKSIKLGMSYWIQILTEVLQEAGNNKKLARRRAEDILARLQGTLIVARGISNSEPFLRFLRELPSEVLQN